MDHGTWKYTVIIADVTRDWRPEINPLDPETLGAAWVPLEDVENFDLLNVFGAQWPDLMARLQRPLEAVESATPDPDEDTADAETPAPPLEKTRKTVAGESLVLFWEPKAWPLPPGERPEDSGELYRILQEYLRIQREEDAAKILYLDQLKSKLSDTPQGPDGQECRQQ